MALALRVRSVHSGLPGSPYLTLHHFEHSLAWDPNEMTGLVAGFWEAARNACAAPWEVRVQQEVEVFDVESGEIGGSQLGDPYTVTSGTTTPDWTAKQGLIALKTNQYRNGKRVQGHVYMPAVPSGAGEQVPLTGYLSTVGNATSGLIEDSANAGNPWSVWSRPHMVKTPDGIVNQNDGILSGVSTYIVRPYWSVLRSRR